MARGLKKIIEELELRRCTAMRDGSLQTLDTLLDKDLHFGHANGEVDSKSLYLVKVAQGRIVYRSIEWTEQKVKPLGTDYALVTGRMISNVIVNGFAKRLDNRVLAVWLRQDGAWRLRAFQSTPLPQELPQS